MNDRPAYKDDLELTGRARKGDLSAREAIAVRFRCVKRFVAMLNSSKGCGLSPDEVDDLTQDVVTAVLEKGRSVSGRSSARSLDLSILRSSR